MMRRKPLNDNFLVLKIDKDGHFCKAVKFALNALNEFNSNTNFFPRTTVFFKKCGNRKRSRYQLPHFLPHFHRIYTEFNSPKIKNFKF